MKSTLTLPQSENSVFNFLFILILRFLKNFNLGITRPHLHTDDGQMVDLPTDMVQLEIDQKVSFVKRNSVPKGAIPVSWGYNSKDEKPIVLAFCCDVSVEEIEENWGYLPQKVKARLNPKRQKDEEIAWLENEINYDERTLSARIESLKTDLRNKKERLKNLKNS